MKKLLIQLFLVLQLLNTRAQSNQIITGEIIDSHTLQPLKVVVASILGSNQITVSDHDGKFVITAFLGPQTLVLTHPDYHSKTFVVELTLDRPIDLGTILLKKKPAPDHSPQLNVLNAADFFWEDADTAYNFFPLLQSSKDIFQKVSVFNWGQVHFKVRQLDQAYGKITINGILMNKIHDGRPQWSNWSGLNDLTRNRSTELGTTPSDEAFGGLLGSQGIYTRASEFPKVSRMSFTVSNTNYNWFPAVTYVSGINKKGWAYAFSTSYRGANEAYFEGTNTDASALFIAIEKKINSTNNLNFTTIYTHNKRGKNAPLTDEVTDLKSFRYNPHWGWQGNHKRNSRYQEVEEPILMLTHYWSMNSKNTLTSSVSYQFGKTANSRLGFNGAPNPDPTYYKNLPSYYTNFHDRNGVFQGNTEPYRFNALQNRDYFLNHSQINWNNIYLENRVNGDSRIILQQDHVDDKFLSFHSNLHTRLSDPITMNVTLNYRKLYSENYSKVTDLLGGNGYKDVNSFFQNEPSQPDLNHPNRIVFAGDRFGYNYNLLANILDGFIQFKYNHNNLGTYIAHHFTYTTYQRDGLYKNGIYPINSLGKSQKVTFSNFGIKGGITYDWSSRQAVHINFTYASHAPHLKNAFSNMRLNNSVTPNLNSEYTYSFDGSYIRKTKLLKTRLTAYFTEIRNATDLSQYYAEGIGVVNDQGSLLDDHGDAFATEILTGINQRNLGIELGLEYQLSPTIKSIFALGLGQGFYTNNPNIQLHIDRVGRTDDYGTAYLKNYKVATGPQTAVSLGLEYRNHKNYWLGFNANYFNHNYTQISPIRRTDNFVKDPQDPNLNPFVNLTENEVRKLWSQEKLPRLLLFNINSGKSWRLSGKNIGFALSIRNLFNLEYKTTGFEQARNANYDALAKDLIADSPSFGTKYYYGYGRNYHINIYYNF